MKNNFDLYSKYYNLLYHKKDYIAEADYITKCIEKYFPGAKSILEFGSGTGRHGMILKKKGYDIYGLERSKKMVDVARSYGFPCEYADITKFHLARKFDTVLSLFHVISYINDNASLVNVFKNAYKSLNPGGLFLFDVWYSPAVYYQKPEIRIKRVENDEISLIRVAVPEMHNNENIVDVNYTILVKAKAENNWIEFQEKHPMRHFTIPEIDVISSFLGFELIKSEEFLSGNKPSENTWGVIFILKKNE